MLSSIPDFLGALTGDERNVVLTLARIIVTLETVQIVGKDTAAQAIALRLTNEDRFLLEYAG